MLLIFSNVEHAPSDAAAMTTAVSLMTKAARRFAEAIGLLLESTNIMRENSNDLDDAEIWTKLS